jgi:hypothetical protein
MMDKHFSEHEELLLKSWDAPVSASERENLAMLMQNDHALRKQGDHYMKIRELLLRHEPDSFGPFFAERILNQLKQRVNEIDYLIFFFFKKYQVLVAGVVVALLITNLLLSDQLTLKSIFGIDQQATEDVFNIDLYENLTEQP